MFGLLGPNGAGKTSTVEILEGLRPQSGGTVSVCGMDPQTGRLRWQTGGDRSRVARRRHLPVKVNEALTMFASFYDVHRETGGLLKRFGLEEKRDAFYSTLSGGQKQRLALAMSLVNEPKRVLVSGQSRRRGLLIRRCGRRNLRHHRRD